MPSALIALPYALLASRLVVGSVFAKAASQVASISCVSLFWFAGAWVISMIIRGIWKNAEDRLFAEGTRFPTTEILLWNNDRLSNGMKATLHEKLKNDCGIALFSARREKANIGEARKTARDAVNLIRPVVGRGVHSRQYNTHYGFWRNFASSAWIGAVGFGVLAAMGFRAGASASAAIAVVFALIYLVAFLCRDALMKSYGYRYANVLLSEYLALNFNGQNS